MGLLKTTSYLTVLLSNTLTASANGVSYFVNDTDGGVGPEGVTWGAWFDFLVTSGSMDAVVEHSPDNATWAALASATIVTSGSANEYVAFAAGNIGPYIRARSILAGGPAGGTCKIYLAADVLSVSVTAA